MSYPGKVLDTNPTGVCDDCENNAFIKVVGECDSCGYETITWCKSCYGKYQDYRKKEREDYAAELLAEYETLPTRG